MLTESVQREASLIRRRLSQLDFARVECREHVTPLPPRIAGNRSPRGQKRDLILRARGLGVLGEEGQRRDGAVPAGGQLA